MLKSPLGMFRGREQRALDKCTQISDQEGFERAVIYSLLCYKPGGNFGKSNRHCQCGPVYNQPDRTELEIEDASLWKGLALFSCLLRDVQAPLLMHDIGKCNFTALVSPALEGNRIFCPIR